MKPKHLLENGAPRAVVKLEKSFRSARLEVSSAIVHRAAGDDGKEADLLELEFAFASENPVERYFGFEELEVSSKAARLDRVTQGVCQLLDNHNSRAVVGRVLSVTIGSDRVARARVRFSRSAAARDVVQDVVDGIRQGVSFAYRVHEMLLIETGDGGDRYRVTDWELFEITLSSMPADPTVGIHRSADEVTFEAIVSRENPEMKLIRALNVKTGEIVEVDESLIDGKAFLRVASPIQQPETSLPTDVRPGRDNTPPSRDAILAAERERVEGVELIARQFNASEELKVRAIKGLSVEQFVAELRLERAKKGEPLAPPPTDLDLSTSDRESFKVLNAVRVLYDRKNGRRGENCLELEASEEIAKRLDRQPRGFFVPYDVLNRSPWNGKLLSERAATTTTTGAGLVGTDLHSEGFIELLRNRSLVGRLGATIIPGLVGNVDFPKQLTDATIGWVGEGAGSGDSNLTFGVVSMTPKTVRSRIDLTRRMLLQSSPAVEGIARNSIMIGIAKGIDIAALAGAGGATVPEGVLNMSGVGSGTWVTTDGGTEFLSAIELETLIAVANADPGSLAYATTPEVRGRLKGKFLSVGSGERIWTGKKGEGEVNGYSADVTNALPKTLGGGGEHPVIAGYWPWLYIGEWGVLDLMPDEVTLGDSAGLVLRGFQDVDVVAAHEAAFAVSTLTP